ncbi:NET1-associated nuclear protein 1 [Coemansia guatemalensis]|uniref:NET1-associated nuclear protein 1 n=1 Tax=Coemansia guatemalensis TaxID=2761395 RepID=A0A9W8LU29_9FUNG|nr:NET1-associated nuclear protein 1 [Coemansia guatemalensis]
MAAKLTAAPEAADSERATRKTRKAHKENKTTTTNGTHTSTPKQKSRPAKLQLSEQITSNGASSFSSLANSLKTPVVQSTISAEDTETFRALELKLVSGGLLTNDPIVFSRDSSLFYLAKDNAVAVYNVQNGEMVQNFSAHRTTGGMYRSSIKAIVVDHSDEEGRRVYTFSADHRARLWDADTGELLSVWELGALPLYAVADPTHPGRFYCALRRQKIKSKAGDKVRYSVARVTLEGGSVETEELFRLTNILGLAVRSDGRWVAAYSNFRVHVAFLRPAGVVQHMWRMTERVSAVAFHPTEPVLAVGDWRGRIMFWFCVDETREQDTEDREIIRRPHHWHAHRVNAIAFTEDGTMLSGGEEGVLVFWQLLTDSRDYLPRLGSDIVGISVSPDQMSYAVLLRDNTIRIFSAVNHSLVSSLQGLKFAERGMALETQSRSVQDQRMARLLDDDPFTTGLVVHPATHSLVLNGEPGHLQVFNHLNDRHLTSIEVASFNRVSGTSASRVSRPHVDLVQYSLTGLWMATVDSRRSSAQSGQGASCSTSYLKLWKFNPSDQSYKLVTRIDNPHTGGVNAIAFCPAMRRSSEDKEGLLCVSTGRGDGMFRVWELQDIEGGGHVWTCRNTAQYRGMQPGGAAFSSDGSMLAVSFGGTVTLWDACAEAMVGSLVASAATPQLTGLGFVGGSFLAAWSAERLDMWNMLTGTVWWTLAMPIQSVFVHQRAPLLALAAYQLLGSNMASVMVFSPASPTPLLSLQHAGGVEAVALVPTTTESKADSALLDAENQPKLDPLEGNSLVVLTPTGLLSVYGALSDAAESGSGTLDNSEEQKPLHDQSRAMESTVFASIFGNLQPIESNHMETDLPAIADTNVRSTMRLVRSAVQSSYVNAPHHVLPPVSALFQQFVSAQLAPIDEQKDATTQDQMDEDDLIIDSADGDDDVDIQPSAPAAVDLWSDESEAFFASMRNAFNSAA